MVYPSIIKTGGFAMNRDRPIVGIDVAKESSYYCILTSTGEVFLKPFEAKNDLQGLNYVLERLQKTEETFGIKPAIVLESTGHYSSRLVHTFTSHMYEVFLVNPIQSHCIKTAAIRKVKTDKVDCEDLARLYMLKDLTPVHIPSSDLADLKVLCRTLHELIKQKARTVSKLAASLEPIWPGFHLTFSNLSSKGALAILSNYPSPTSFLKADQEALIQSIAIVSRRNRCFAEKKYQILRKTAEEALLIGVPVRAYAVTVETWVVCLKQIIDLIDDLNTSIRSLSSNISDVALLQTIPGIGESLAPIIAGEIGGINRFHHAKQLVAYAGVDPSVRQSGKFVGTKNKLTKRGSPYLRWAIFIAATVSVRKDSRGFLNPVIGEYYENKIKTKARKQALGAIMNKLLRIIFSVLKSRKPFQLRTSLNLVVKDQNRQLTVA